MGFLRHIIGNRARCEADGSWDTPNGRAGDIYGGNSVNGHIHRPPEGNSSIVGGPTTTNGGLHVGNWI